jgi:hypothetical protein
LQADDLDPEEAARQEKKRRQNTQVVRRSRICNAEEVQKLQNRVADLEAEVIAANSVSLMRHVMQLDSIRSIASILNLVGDRKVARPFGKRLNAGVSSANVIHVHSEQSSDVDYEFETKSGARAGS